MDIRVFFVEVWHSAKLEVSLGRVWLGAGSWDS